MKKICLITILLLVSVAYSAPEDAELILEEEVETSYDSPLTAGLDLLYVPARYPNYRWSNVDQSGQAGIGAQINLEWLPLARIEGLYGKPGIGAGVGFRNIKNVPLSEFGGANAHLYAAPFETFISYRADFFDRQVIVPFGKVGLGMMLVTQDIELPSGLNSSHYTYWGFNYAVGVEFCLNVLDRKSARSLDASTGINATYLMLEYASSSSLTSSNTQDMSESEYRLGFRFEI